MNTSILKVCFKYTSEFKDRYISLESLLQAYFWVSKINKSILKVYFKYTSDPEKNTNAFQKHVQSILEV